MLDAQQLITDNIDVWTSAIKKRNATGRGSSKKIELTGIKKLRELILELAVRGKLVPQDASDEPASVLLARIAEEKAQLVADKKIKKIKALPEVTDEDKPFELPNGWSFERLGNYSIVFSGSSFKSGDFNSTSGVRVIKITNAGVGKLIETDEFLPESFLEKFESFQVFKNDLILALTRPYIHDGLKVSLCPDSYHKSLLNQRVAAIRAFEYPEYLFLNLRSPYILNLYKNRFGGNGLQPNLKMSDVTELVIAIPPLAEQQRIVAKVDELMALCDQLEQQTKQSLSAHQTLVEVLLAALTESKDLNDFQVSWQRISEHFDVLFTTELSIEQLKQTILQLAVMGKLVPQNPSDEPASVLLEKIAEEKAQLIADKKINKQKPLAPVKKEEKYCVLPEQWKWVRLGEVLQVISDYHANGSYKILKKNVELLDHEDFAIMLRTTNFSKSNYHTYKYINEHAYHFMSKSKLYGGDIIMNKIGDPGASFYVEDRGKPMSLAMNLFLLRTQKVNSKFIYLYLKSNYEYIQRFANGTSTQTITKDAVYNLAFPLCSIEEQEAILQKVDELMALCEQLKARLSDAQTTQLHLADAVVTNALN